LSPNCRAGWQPITAATAPAKVLPMPDLNWGAFDLNLLIVFDAVMRERSVTRAGARVGLSQPAMSHALARLRHVLRDELFIRTPQGMLPTGRAEEIAVPIRRALGDLQLSLHAAEFDPALATRTFRIAVDPYAAAVLAAPIVARCIALAPGLTLDIRASGSLDLTERLDRGDLDLAIGAPDPDGERFAHQPLLHDDFVAVLRGPAATLGADAFAALPHLEISTLDDDLRFVDHALAARGLKRRIALRMPYLSAGPVLAASPTVAALRRRMAERLAQAHGLEVLPLPHPSPRIETAMHWHRRADGLMAHRWLRDTVAEVAHAL
jgi:DNA-binding transcriptional LysR family regulator